MKKRILILCWSLTFFLSCSSPMYKGLLTWDEYNNKPSDKPHILELSTEEGSLVYYGVHHTINPTNPQIIDIEKRWEDFKPTVAFCEGCVWPLEKTRGEAIRKQGEQGFLRFLAARDNVSIKSIEPNHSREALHLLKYFPSDRIKIFYVLRQAVINRKMRKDLNDLKYVDKILKDLSKIKPFKNPPYSLPFFNKEVSRLFPDLRDWRMVPEYLFCLRTPEIWTNKICFILNDFRNQHMLKTLIGEIKKGRKVFAVVGRSHVLMQEPVLRSVLGDGLPDKTTKPKFSTQSYYVRN